MQIGCNVLLKFFSRLSEEDKQSFLCQLQKTYAGEEDGATLDAIVSAKRDEGIVCPHCQSMEVVKFGTAGGKQRYRCSQCKRTFSDLSDSILAYTKKDIRVWKEYAKCLLDRLPIRKSAQICGIHRNTAFAWRHKLLDALAIMQRREKQLTGVVEADEMFINISYKGTTPLDRPSRKRGEPARKRGISREKVCITCAVDRRRRAYSRIATLGKVTIKALNRIMSRRISKLAILCTDREKAYVRFARKNGIKLIQLESGKDKLGTYHINTVNSYHYRLRKFLMGFAGVSTKYLNNYLVWFNAMQNKALDALDMLKRTVKATVFTRWSNLSNRPAVPVVS